MLTLLLLSLYCDDCAPVTAEAAATRTANSEVVGCARLRLVHGVDGINSVFLLGEKRKQKSSMLGVATTSGLFLMFHDLLG